MFREISAPERIVLVHSFSDEDGGVSRHPSSPAWPLEMLLTIVIEEMRGRAKLTIQCFPQHPTEAERKTFDESHEVMSQGWRETFEQLGKYLART